MEGNEATSERDQKRLCYGNPLYYCIDCDAQICHLCAHVFHDTHKVIPIYTGEMFTNLDTMVQQVLSDNAVGGVA